MAHHKTIQTEQSEYGRFPRRKLGGPLYQSIRARCSTSCLIGSIDPAALHGLGECRNWDEVSSVNSKWLQDMSKDYSAEAIKVMAIYTKQGADAVQERRPRA